MTLPPIDPVAFSLGSIHVRWYGIMYLLTFVIGYFLIGYFAKERKLKVNSDWVSDLLVTVLLGVILGGRLGYILFYNLAYYISYPADIIKVWEGGMSFHGGMLGVILGLAIFAKIKKISFYKITDTIIPIVPIGIMLVRMGNFINGELYGRVTESKFCFNFATDPANCRYPSQLIAAVLEGLCTFIILFTLRKRIKTPGILSWIFILSYGALRFIAEFFREPDVQIGYYLNVFTQGQLFSIIMVVVAGVGMILTKKITRSRTK